jgi:colicin import membrane protein
VKQEAERSFAQREAELAAELEEAGRALRAAEVQLSEAEARAESAERKLGEASGDQLRRAEEERESRFNELEQRIKSVVDRASDAQAHAASVGIELPARTAPEVEEPKSQEPEPEEAAVEIPDTIEEPEESEEPKEPAQVAEPKQHEDTGTAEQGTVEQSEPGLLQRVAEARRAKRKEREAKRAAREKEAAERRAARERESAEKKAAREKEAAEKKAARERQVAEKKAKRAKERDPEQPTVESAPAPPTLPSPPKPGSGDEGAALDVNQATFEQLRGIGLSVTQATRVIAYRERKDGFDSVDDLEGVPGFPKSLLDELRENLTV